MSDGFDAFVDRDGVTYARIVVGGERDPIESPCPGCGAYYFEAHVLGCDMEECPSCGGPLSRCTCFGAPSSG